jgi:hypothetical protein
LEARRRMEDADSIGIRMMETMKMKRFVPDLENKVF